MKRVGLVAISVAAIIANVVSSTAAPPKPAPACFGVKPTIVRGAGDNRIRGTSERDVIVAGGGHDVVRAGRGPDLICGGKGNDKILAGRGDDRLTGGPASDVFYTSDYRRDIAGGLFGERGDDRLRGASGMDGLRGGIGDDVVRGGRDWDSPMGSSSTHPERKQFWRARIVGGSGSDRLFGGSGADTLNSRDGVEGNDRIDGGSHAGFHDRCRSDPDIEVRCERFTGS